MITIVSSQLRHHRLLVLLALQIYLAMLIVNKQSLVTISKVRVTPKMAIAGIMHLLLKLVMVRRSQFMINKGIILHLDMLMLLTQHQMGKLHHMELKVMEVKHLLQVLRDSKDTVASSPVLILLTRHSSLPSQVTVYHLHKLGMVLNNLRGMPRAMEHLKLRNLQPLNKRMGRHSNPLLPKGAMFNLFRCSQAILSLHLHKLVMLSQILVLRELQQLVIVLHRLQVMLHHHMAHLQ